MTPEMPSTMGRIAPDNEQGVSLYDRAGKLVHRGPSYLHIAATSAAANLLDSASDRTARALAMLYSPGATLHSVTLRQQISVGTERYTVQATAGANESIVVRVERLAIRNENVTVRVRHGFTLREFEVAMLVALGATNREIATQLGISEKTSRRHTDAVFRKLGVNARSKVAPFVLGAGHLMRLASPRLGADARVS